MAECQADKCPMEGKVLNWRNGLDPYCFWKCGLRPPEPAEIVATTRVRESENVISEYDPYRERW
jgi:hypothetical protein